MQSYSFVNQIKNGSKYIAKKLLDVVKNDVGSTTGSNLRGIMQLMEKDSIEQLSINDIQDKVFANIPIGCEWRILVLEELLSVRNSTCEIENFTKDDINEMIDFICTT